MTNARTPSWRTHLAAGLLLALVACGDDASVTTPPTGPPATRPVTPTPTPATVVLEGQQAFPAPPNPKGGTSIANWNFTTPTDGTLDVTISYLHDSSSILVWVTDRPCNKWQFERDECFYLAKSIEGSRPRKLTAAGVKAGGYSLFVANDGPNDEQIGYQVALRP